MGLKELLFGKKDAETGIDPLADLVLSKLRVGYLLDYDLQTWQVSGYCRYEWAEGEAVEEWELTAGREKRYLELAEEQWSLGKKIPIGALDGDVRAHVLSHDDPPERIVYKGKEYYLDASYAGSMFADGNRNGQEVIRWEFVDEDEESFVGIEQWSETDVTASSGILVEDYQFTNILPASPE